MADGKLRRVAMLGAARIPFCRGTPATPNRPISRCCRRARRPRRQVQPQGRADRRGDGRRGDRPQPRFQPCARGGARARLSPTTPGTNMMQIACGTSLQAALARRQDRHRRDRERHRRRLRHDERQPDRVRRQVPAAPDRAQSRAKRVGEKLGASRASPSASLRP